MSGGGAGAPPLVLASASPRRRELLAALGLPFEAVPSHADETGGGGDPARLARALALRKARAVAAARPDAAVVGGDTIVLLGGRRLGKPAGGAEAAAMLAALRGRAHEVVTGVAVVRGAAAASASATAAVTMREYGDAEIARYVASGEPFDKAGGYAVQDGSFRPASAVEGCRCAVIGLPLWLLRRMLRETAGLEARPPDRPGCAGCPQRGGGGERGQT